MTSLHRPSLTCIWNTVRSLALPMVWARISLLAQGSSEWFEAVSEELANAFNVSRNSTVEAHLMLGNSFSHGNHLSACVYPVDSKSLSILNDAVTQERSRTQMTYPTRNSASWKAISRARVLIPTPQQRSITRARVLLTLARSSWAIYRGEGSVVQRCAKGWWEMSWCHCERTFARTSTPPYAFTSIIWNENRICQCSTLQRYCKTLKHQTPVHLCSNWSHGSMKPSTKSNISQRMNVRPLPVLQKTRLFRPQQLISKWWLFRIVGTQLLYLSWWYDLLLHEESLFDGTWHWIMDVIAIGGAAKGIGGSYEEEEGDGIIGELHGWRYLSSLLLMMAVSMMPQKSIAWM